MTLSTEQVVSAPGRPHPGPTLEVAVPEYWFNVATGQVEEGHRSDSTDLMGPYPTREDAGNALQKARENTERWDEEDREWNEGPRK